MIINKIRARNVLRYAELSIDPAEKGLIAISGRNESGKSSIGETVCFALFGRTFSFSPTETLKIVRWGESECSVDLEFSVEDRRYLLSRFLDSDGNHGAKLVATDDPENHIARGVQNVSDALFRILGFEYEEFVESFYLAQREITTPHPHSQAVKIMAGIAPLERVMGALDSEISEREELLGELSAEWDSVDGDVQALGIQPGRMQRLEDERNESSTQLEQVNQLTGDIGAGLETCARNTSEVNRLEGSKGRTGFLRFVVLLLALAAAALWALLQFGPQLPQADTARDFLVRFVPDWSDQKIPWIGYLAIGLGVLFLLLWMRVAKLRRQMAMLREETRQLGVVLGHAREIDYEGVPVESEADEGEDAELTDEETSEDRPIRPDQTEYDALRKLLDRDEAPVRVAQDYGERELGWFGYVADNLNGHIAELDEVIDEEQARLQEALDLSDVLNGLTDKREEVEERIADRRRALELLDGATGHASSAFNRDIKDLVVRMLPLFTDGRYEHLQIDQDLRVRVYSADKRAFMDLDEVSSGTQRQIMLALRLALSKKLLSRTIRGKQFAFLDEPFAFFDQERTRRALQALANIGDDVSQVWIVAQDFPADCEVEFDTKIYCDRDSNTLKVEA